MTMNTGPLPRGSTFQGKPCKKGHSGLRYASTGGCVECVKQQSAERRRALQAQLARGG